MVQTWILDEDNHPVQAYRQGKDSAVCGNCRRASKPSGGDGSCYVNLGFAPNTIWNSYKRSLLIPGSLSFKHHGYNSLVAAGKDQHIRLGAYGDPAFIPYNIWDTYLTFAASWTGYTHQWRTCDQRLKKYCMASVDTIEEALDAQDLGWRTFRVYYNDVEGTSPYRHKLKEAICPASKEAGKKIQCINCPPMLKCYGNGNNLTEPYNIVIKEH